MWICRDVCRKEGFAKIGKCDSKTVNGWSETRAGDPEQLGITSQRLQDVFEGRNGSRIDASARNGLIWAKTCFGLSKTRAEGLGVFQMSSYRSRSVLEQETASRNEVGGRK
jgi:hypothetical protein